MAEARVIRREWMVEVRFDEAEVPDVPKSYTSITMRPYAATILFVASGDEGLMLDAIDLHGHRVNKNGPGATVNERLYSVPEWLVPMIDQAKELTRG